MRKLREYEIEIKEELSKVVKIKAESLSEAIEMVTDKYNNSNIVLNADDYKGVEILVYKNCE